MFIFSCARLAAREERRGSDIRERKARACRRRRSRRREGGDGGGCDGCMAGRWWGGGGETVGETVEGWGTRKGVGVCVLTSQWPYVGFCWFLGGGAREGTVFGGRGGWEGGAGKGGRGMRGTCVRAVRAISTLGGGGPGRVRGW